MKLGKKPARHAMKFKFGDVINATKLPEPPLQYGSYQLIPQWFGLGNDQYSNCVFAGAAHEHMMWTVEGGAPRARFTIKDTLSDYAAVTGFDPKRPETDQGTDMKDAAEYRRTTGIIDATGARHKIDAYLALRHGDPKQLTLAAWLTGAVGVGFMLPESSIEQTKKGQIWEDVGDRNHIGGHYVAGGWRDTDGNFVFVSWGKLQKATPTFISTYMDEGAVYIVKERMKNRVSPEGYDDARLTEMLSTLT